MKKILSFIAAFAIIASCCSCDKKKDKNKDKNETDIVDTTGEAALDKPVEDEFRTYGKDYFTTINVNTTYTDAKPPVKDYVINLTNYDFGSRKPPCKDEKYIDRYKYIDEHVYEDEYKKQLEEMWEKSMTEPTDGMAGDVCIDGKYIYAVVSYDVMCTGMHEVSIFRIDSENNEKTEIFRHSDPETSCRIVHIYRMNGVLYVIKLDDHSLCYLDEDKKELVNIKELPEDINTVFCPNNAGRLIIETIKEERELVPNDYEPKKGEELYSYDGTQTYLMKGRDNAYEEFDFDTKTWKTLYSVHTLKDDPVELGTPEYPEMNGKYFAWKEKPEGSRKIDIVTEKYRVSTGLTGCEVKYADDDKVMAVQYNMQGSGASESRLHIFNLKKAEHYIIDSSKYGSRFSVLGDGLIVSTTGGSGDIYYLLPELGMFFRLTDINGVNMGINQNYYSNPYLCSEGSVALNVTKQVNPHEVELENGDKITDYDFETELHWFTLEE